MYCDKLVIPASYNNSLNLRQTETAIKAIKDKFEVALANNLNLQRVSAPLFVNPTSGLNDNLNGIERPVSFDVPAIGGENVEIVHSLAKWKRMALKRYDFEVGEGLYTDMNAIRRDEEFDNLHSMYVDQWDWEKIITREERNIETLISTVESIYDALIQTEHFICDKFSQLTPYLPKKITFITSQQLLDKYPDMNAKERENAIAKEYGAVFIMKIGAKLSNDEIHDNRAPDYDDWSLNGDILIDYKLLGMAVELSSMGIRVDEDTLLKQLKISGCEDRKNLPFHKSLISGELPYTIGGGIGQSRLCMILLQKAHIGEVQVSTWAEDMLELCSDSNIEIL